MDPENYSGIDQETAIQELGKGRELMAELSSLLRGITSWPDGDRSELAGVLFGGIMEAFELGIPLVKSININVPELVGTSTTLQHDYSSTVAPAATFSVRGSSSSSNCSGEAARSRTGSTVSPKPGEQKRNNISYSKTVVTDSPFAGDQQWRKYGEKKIKDVKNPRCYYRCGHGECSAKLQVQQIDGLMYQVTYNNEHTCKISANAHSPPARPGHPQLICFQPAPTSRIRSSRDQINEKVPLHHNTNVAVLVDTPTSSPDDTSSFPVIVPAAPAPSPPDPFYGRPPSPPGPFYAHA